MTIHPTGLRALVPARTRKPDISETDVSSKKMKIQKRLHRYLTKPDTIARSFKGGRYVMIVPCRLFRSDGWRFAGHPFEFVSAFLTIYIGPT